MKLARLAVASVLVSACATPTPKAITLPDGSRGYSTTCPNTGACMNTAAKHCGGRYVVIDETPVNAYARMVFACAESGTQPSR